MWDGKPSDNDICAVKTFRMRRWRLNPTFAKSGEGPLWSNGPKYEAHSNRGSWCPTFQFADCNRDRSPADVGCHAPPRGVRMPRSFGDGPHAGELLRPQVVHVCFRG
jgi:hypothetical protein